MGSDRAVTPGAGPAEWPVAGSLAGDQQDLVEAADGGSVAGPAGAVRAVEDPP